MASGGREVGKRRALGLPPLVDESRDDDKGTIKQALVSELTEPVPAMAGLPWNVSQASPAGECESLALPRGHRWAL